MAHTDGEHYGEQFNNTLGHVLAVAHDQDLALYIQNRSARTRADYMKTARMFAEWLIVRGQNVHMRNITTGMVRAFLADFASTPNKRTGGKRSPAYLSRIQRGLVRLFRFAVAEGVIEHNPMEGVPLPTVEVKPVPILRDADIECMVSAAKLGEESPVRSDHFVARRRVATVRLAFDTGARAGELSNADVTDIDFQRGTIYLHGKTGAREVWVSPEARLALRRMLAVRTDDSPALFVSITGRRMDSHDLSADLHRLGEKAGVRGSTYAHRFRHSAASAWLANGGSEADATARFGWRPDSTMVRRYGYSAAQERANNRARELYDQKKHR